MLAATTAAANSPIIHLWMAGTERSREGPPPFTLSLFQVPPPEQLRDLHRVECGTLAQIVADAPEDEAVFDRRVLAHAAHIGGVFADALDRRNISAVLTLVDEHHTRSLTQDR